jgi:5-(carboxyamino)imidazole ribonucleotide mutase
MAMVPEWRPIPAINLQNSHSANILQHFLGRWRHQCGHLKSKIPIPMAQVGIIMGSDSDLPTMQGAIAMCEQFNVSYEVAIVSAHRTPERMVDYAKQAHLRGFKVIIAGAGGAAHLPGMVAALTPLPVIGVPIPTRHLQGVDSLYSIVQMPVGISVATVAIGNAQNAGLLAVQILATQQLLEKVQRYRQSLTEMVMEKQAKLDEVGYRQYLQGKDSNHGSET